MIRLSAPAPRYRPIVSTPPAQVAGSSRGTALGVSALAAGLPERLVAAGVRRAREDEEQVAEPVQVDERRAGSARAPPRTASTSRSARRQIARATCSRAAASEPPGSTKLFSSGSGAFASSQSCLEPVDRLLRDAQLPVALGERDREVGAEVEELVLDALERADRAASTCAQPRTEFSSSTAP